MRGGRGGRAGGWEGVKSAPRLSSLEEVMNVKYEPPKDDEGGAAAARAAAGREGRNKSWKWLPRRAAFLVKALPRDVKRVGGRKEREGGREGGRKDWDSGGMKVCACSLLRIGINTDHILPSLPPSLPPSLLQVHRRDQPRVLVLWYLLLLLFLSWCIFVLAKTVNNRNTPAQVRPYPPSSPPSLPPSPPLSVSPFLLTLGAF